MPLFPRLGAIHRHNANTLKAHPLAELSGSLGDLGTLLPLMTALVISGSISLPATLLFTGLANILTGVVFGIPLPVQPMKAIAAVAVARGFSLEENAAAGIVVAAAVGLLSASGAILWAERVTPVPVVKGIQVGAGLSLCLSAGTNMLAPLTWTGPWWGDNLLWAVAAVIFLISTFAYPRLPYALLIFTIGILLSALRPHDASATPIPDTPIPILHPTLHNFWTATSTAALGQFPLTILNSVIAASALAADLLPSPPFPSTPSTTALGLSVAATNLIACWFGAMPACHGSGGLAGQYRFGARSGSSVIVLGIFKVILGLVAVWNAAPLVRLLAGIPKALLGILVLGAGVELAKVAESVNSDARDLRQTDERLPWDGKRVKVLDERERRERFSVLLVTVAGVLAFRNDAVGFLAGLAWHWGLRGARWVEERRAEREGHPLWRNVPHSSLEGTGLLAHEESDTVA